MKHFVIEKKQTFSQHSSMYLRNLYLPIIGTEAVLLFQLLEDIYLLKFQYQNLARNFVDISEIAAKMQKKETEIEQLLCILEAVGLSRRYSNKDQTRFIISLLEPSKPEILRKNPILYPKIISRIGEIAFQNIEFHTKGVEHDKNECVEITSKHHDILKIEDKKQNTIEIPLVAPKTIDEAILSLATSQFIHFLTKESVSPSQLASLQRALNNGLASSSINLISHYVIKRNERFVNAYFDKIANSFAAQKASFEEIKSELEKATKKVRVNSKVNPDNAVKDEEWSDIFDALGGEI